MIGNLIKISLFPKGTDKETVMTKNKIILDNICRSCTVEEDITSGNYILDADFLIDSQGLWENLVEESILKVKVDYGTEIFAIKKVKKQSKYISVVAVQMTIHACNTLWLEDVRPTDTNGQGALSHMLSNAIGKKKEIVLQSNISTINTTYYQRKRLQEALFGSDNSFIDRWGGEVLRRGYTLSINDRIGTDRGVVIRRGKNLTGFEGTTDLDQLCTMAKGVGFDGITHEGYVMSPLAEQYDQYYPREFKYDDVKVKTENDTEGYDTLEEAQAELIRRVNLEYTKNHVDELRAEYNLSFIPLSMTEEYKHLVSETIYLGDTVKIQETLLGIDLKVRVISRKYDVMKQKPISMTLSNIPIEEKRNTVSDSAIIKDLKDSIKQNGNSVADYIQNMINSGSTNSYVLYRQNEILAMDNKDINSAINVVRLNKHGLAFSNQGYYSEYTYGFTIDGVLNASLIRTGILSAILIQSVNGATTLDLNSGLFKSKQEDGSEIIISPTEGFYNKFGDSKREYYHLNYYDLKNVTVSTTGTWSLNITLPNEFKGKKFVADCNYKEILSTYPLTLFGNQRIYQEVDYTNGIIKLSGTVFPLCVEFYTSGSQTYLMEHKGSKTVTVKISINVIA